MHELGLLDEFLKRPHQELRELNAQIGNARLTVADFSHLPTRCKFIAFMPQWDFLDFLAEHARRYPAFHLRMEAEVTDLVYERERVIGVRAKTPRGTLEIYAELVVGADGRSSAVRERAGLEILEFGAPMDVLWLRISKGAGDPTQSLGRIDAGKLLAMIDRGDYWLVRVCHFQRRSGRNSRERITFFSGGDRTDCAIPARASGRAEGVERH